MGKFDELIERANSVFEECKQEVVVGTYNVEGASYVEWMTDARIALDSLDEKYERFAEEFEELAQEANGADQEVFHTLLGLLKSLNKVA